MNHDMMLAVADTIEHNPDAFDMGEWVTGSGICDTKGCVAYWAVWVHDPTLATHWADLTFMFRRRELTQTEFINAGVDWERRARDILDLGFTQAYSLFHGYWSDDDFEERLGATAEEAAAQLRAIVTTDKAWQIPTF